MRPLVLDTNIVLDLFVFKDEAARALQGDLANGTVQWLATPAMREELVCVLAYEQIGGRMGAASISAEQVLAGFDQYARVVDAAPPAKVVCRDADDQKFIDLAIAHSATLVSKDKQVLALGRKLALLGITVTRSP